MITYYEVVNLLIVKQLISDYATLQNVNNSVVLFRQQHGSG